MRNDAKEKKYPGDGKHILAGSVTALAIITSAPALADQTPGDIAELKQLIDKNATEYEARIEELEDLVGELESRVGNRAVIRAFDGLEVNLGGFYHSAFTYIDAEDESVSSFNRQNFELLISARFNESWSSFFAGGFLREADDAFAAGSRTAPVFNSKNKNPAIISWVNYRHSDAFQVRLGRFITPHGIINIEHFPATLLDPEQPQFLRPFSGDTLFPNFSTGVQVHGRRYAGDNIFTYNAYISNYAGAPEHENFGAMVEYTFSSLGLAVGLNYANGARADETDYDLGGLHFRVNKGRLLWKNEVYTTNEDQAENRKGGYTQPAWRLTPKWTAFYRYDVLDNGTAETTENVVGLNYMPYSNVRLRVTYTYKEFDESTDPVDSSTLPETQANILQLSGTFSF